MEIFEYQSKFENSLLQYDKAKALEIFDLFMKENEKIEFIDKIMVNALISIGEKWENGSIALSQVYMSSKICEQLTDILLSQNISVAKNKNTPAMAIVTLEDHHSLGKRIVGSILKTAGYDLIDFGFGITVEELIKKSIEENIKILLISVLMFPSALKIKKITTALKEKNLSIKILVGGAPFIIDDDLWRTVGADAMSKNAGHAMEIIEKWIEEDFNNEL